MKDNTELQQDVLDELRLDPGLDASQIGVTSDGGVVTLTGFVNSYAEKRAAEEATKRVYGVKGLAGDIEVRLPRHAQRTDAEVAKAALAALKWDSRVPEERIGICVHKGWVSLEGTVPWQYQKDAAEQAVENLTGVEGVDNLIRIDPQVNPANVEQEILGAFRRNAELEARRVGVRTCDGKVILAGNVHDWAEAKEAERAARAVPGVTQVENRLTIVP